MSGMARVHLWSRGAFTSRGAKPNGLEFDAHGLNETSKGRLSYYQVVGSPLLSLYRNLAHITLCAHRVATDYIRRNVDYIGRKLSLILRFVAQGLTGPFLQMLRKVWYVPGDCR